MPGGQQQGHLFNLPRPSTLVSRGEAGKQPHSPGDQSERGSTKQDQQLSLARLTQSELLTEVQLLWTWLLHSYSSSLHILSSVFICVLSDSSAIRER